MGDLTQVKKMLKDCMKYGNKKGIKFAPRKGKKIQKSLTTLLADNQIGKAFEVAKNELELTRKQEFYNAVNASAKRLFQLKNKPWNKGEALIHMGTLLIAAANDEERLSKKKGALFNFKNYVNDNFEQNDIKKMEKKAIGVVCLKTQEAEISAQEVSNFIAQTINDPNVYSEEMAKEHQLL